MDKGWQALLMECSLCPRLGFFFFFFFFFTWLCSSYQEAIGNTGVDLGEEESYYKLVAHLGSQLDTEMNVLRVQVFLLQFSSCVMSIRKIIKRI